MTENARRRNILVVLLLLVVVAIILLMTRCKREMPPEVRANTGSSESPSAAPPASASPAGGSSTQATAEVLTPAVLTVPERVAAGAAFPLTWTGPDNQGDYVTIVRGDAPAGAVGDYKETQHGHTLQLTAPMEAGPCEVRYIAVRSKTILGRARLEVEAVQATLDAAPEIMLGARFELRWTGPNNKGDYVTIVPKDALDARYESYVDAEKGSPATLTAPTFSGDAELRYVAGQGKKVLARRPIRVLAPTTTMDAPAEAIAGSTIEVAWNGPSNPGDYITVVPVETPDGQYGNYSNTTPGAPLKLLLPIMSGPAELRFMTAQGERVLARRGILIAAGRVTLSAPAECAAGAPVSIAWTGPDNPGDYVTIVPKETLDGEYGAYTNTSGGTPLTVKAPKQACLAEIRYMTGQGNKVLARIPIKVVP